MYEQDCRNHKNQKFCSKPDCKKASKAFSQKQWLNKAENKDYFKNSDNVRRVQTWREKHPGYSKHSCNGSPKHLPLTKENSLSQSEPMNDASNTSSGDAQEVVINNALQEGLPQQVYDNTDENEDFGYSDQNPLKIQPLQDLLSVQTLDTTGLKGVIKKIPLQDLLIEQTLVLLGLAANLTGATLQDDIAETIRQFTLVGKDILNRAAPIRGD